MERGKTSRYYQANPKAAAKRRKYQRQYNKRPGQSAYRSKLNIARRKAGIYGKGGPDMSHDSKGNLTRESMKINRARNGHGNNKRYRSA
jgi:hypothetical protein